MKIITNQLAKKLPQNHKLRKNKVVNPRDFSEVSSFLKNIENLSIYDITKTSKYPPNTIISVNDHINRTGENLLVGHQKELQIDFIDIAKLYKTKKDSVKTDCCGKKLNIYYQYPSHYLCNISILAKALGVQKISGFLINIS